MKASRGLMVVIAGMMTLLCWTSSPAGSAPSSKTRHPASPAGSARRHTSKKLRHTESQVSLEVSPAKASLMKGMRMQLTVTGKFPDGTMRDVTLAAKWKSSNHKIATVSPSGLVTAVSAKGAAVISATYEGKIAATKITVFVARLRSISVTPCSAMLSQNAPRQFTAVGDYTGGFTRDLTSVVKWKSSNAKAVTISKAGLATALTTKGNATLVASIGKISGSAAVVMAPPLLHQKEEYCGSCHKTTTTAQGGKTFTLVQDVPKLCNQCHVRCGGAASVHAPVKDGMCTYCHTPHDRGESHMLTQPEKDLCLSCHPDKTNYAYQHGPSVSGDCVVCHDPHESVNRRLLVRSGPDLCVMCHFDIQDEIKKKVVHPALDGGCTNCHNPHGSSVKKFLSAEGPKLCYRCHPAIESKIVSAKTVHAPIKSKRGCASCHAPHSSDNPKLLPKTGKDLCLDCHKDIIQPNQTVLHGPIKTGNCTACHDPHGTPNDKLLIKPYSTDFYVSYTEDAFPLCFTCHNRDMLKSPTTTTATKFRDGNRNLHHLHVNRKDRGKSCRVCHRIHASESPKLIADRVTFGTWNFPLKFIKTDTGGSCAPGCHQPYSYVRAAPTTSTPALRSAPTTSGGEPVEKKSAGKRPSGKRKQSVQR